MVGAVDDAVEHRIVEDLPPGTVFGGFGVNAFIPRFQPVLRQGCQRPGVIRPDLHARRQEHGYTQQNRPEVAVPFEESHDVPCNG